MAKREEEIITRAMMKAADLGSQIHAFAFNAMLAFSHYSKIKGFKIDEESKDAFLNMYRLQTDLQVKHASPEAFLESVQKDLEARDLNSNLGITDCASFVFAFTILDGIASDLIEATKELGQEYWKSRIVEKKLSIGEIESVGLEAATKRKIEEIIKEYKGKYIGTQIETLMEIAGPKENSIQDPDYKLDIDLIRKINELRNKIVHEPSSFKRIDDVLEKIDYLKKTAIFLVKCVREKFDVQINGPELVAYMKNRVK